MATIKSFNTGGGIMGNCKFVDELNRLRKSSSDSIDGTDTFDDFKKYMHVSRSAEKDLIEILYKIADSGRKSLVCFAVVLVMGNHISYHI